MLKSIILSMRPKQWTKNLILFAGIVFAQKLGDMQLFTRSCIAFVVFCLISGSIYIINDGCHRHDSELAIWRLGSLGKYSRNPLGFGIYNLVYCEFRNYISWISIIF